MSTVLVVTPLIVAGWPIISAAITAAVGTMGFAAAQNAGPRVRQIADTKSRAEIDVDDSEILAGSAGTGEQMVVERDGIRAIFSRDARRRSSSASRVTTIPRPSSSGSARPWSAASPSNTRITGSSASSRSGR